MGSVIIAMNILPSKPPTNGPVERYPTSAAVKPYGGGLKTCARINDIATIQEVRIPLAIMVYKAPMLKREAKGAMTSLMKLSSEWIPDQGLRFSRKDFFLGI